MTVTDHLTDCLYAIRFIHPVSFSLTVLSVSKVKSVAEEYTMFSYGSHSSSSYFP